MREFTTGMKPRWSPLLNNLLFMITRIIFVVLVVIFSDLYLILKTIIFCLVQLGIVAYVLMVRPLESVRDNIIEATNQLIYLFACCFLIHFDTKPEWSNFTEKLYIILLMAGPGMTIIISLIDLALRIYKKICKRKENNSTRVDNKPKIQKIRKRNIEDQAGMIYISSVIIINI